MAKTLADCLHIADKALKGPQGIPAWWEYDKGRIREAEKAGRTPALAVQELLDEVLAEREAVVSQLEEESSATSRLTDAIIAELETNKNPAFSWQNLFDMADKAYGGTQGEGKYTPKDAYDAMEVAVNRYILSRVVEYGIGDKAYWFDVNDTPEGAINTIKTLKTLLSRLPTQSKRTEEMERFQQFSTPHPFAYAVAWVANIQKGDTVIEPSAGTGNIATMAKLANPKEVIVNELSDRRAYLLKMLFDKVFQEDAEQINNILPADIKPTVVVMNPPFSQTAGRMGKKKDIFVASRHIEQALKRLRPGGRLVAIVGRGMEPNATTFQAWWKNIKNEYNVLANVRVNGKEYAKFGTHFDNQIVVIDKTGETRYDTVTGEVSRIEDLIPLLKGVRDERTYQETADSEARTSAGEQSPVQPTRQEVDATGEGRPRAERPVLPASGALGAGERKSSDQLDAPAEPRSGAVSLEAEEGDGVSSGRTGEQPDVSALAGSEGEPSELRGGRAGAVRQPSERDTSRVSGTEGTISDLDRIAQKKEAKGEITEDLYEGYRPERMKIPGAKPHPAPLVQSAAMSDVVPPVPSYTPSIPEKAIKKGNISDIQIEAVVYAGQVHEQQTNGGAWYTPDGKPIDDTGTKPDKAVFRNFRRGFFIGDGTGVGKGREIAAILWDNWNKGRKKAIWISEKKSLFKDAQRDTSGVGWDPKLIFSHDKVKASSGIKAESGILFTSYDTLKSGGKDITKKSRLDQIVDWLGKDFDGVIAFDESHNMGNAQETRGTRGRTKPSQKALAGVALQRILPNARVVYVSATGATEVSTFAYADRLGIWGEGTPFADKNAFINEISAGGIAAMEMIARDLKSLGLYVARSLSYDGVGYDRIEHTLTPNQREIYDKAAEAWQVVLRNMTNAFVATGIMGYNHIGDLVTYDKTAKSAALSAFWGAHQRFFNQIITAMQTPSVIQKIHKDIAEGNSVVIQLTNTMEAQQKRALEKLEEDESLEDLDLTPRDTIMQLVENSFPVHQYETYVDEAGNERTRPVQDSKGNYVENPEAVAMRDRLLDELGSIKVPDSPLDMILEEFGAKNVAEITGRTQRVVRVQTEKGMERKIERRSVAKSDVEANEFMAGKRNILVFSEAGGTGRSYHADLGAKNQKKRVHYLLQAGWRADKAVQGLGRTHRSNQKQPPQYFLVTTDLKGQKRFISSIARRLDQLGALTKGQRQTGGQGIFQARDNLESDYAVSALTQFFQDLARHNIEAISLSEFEEQTGLRLVDDRTGNMNNALPPVRQFLNRLLSMKIETQNAVFDAFSRRMDEVIEGAARAGTLDQGLETLRAQKIDKVGDQVVYTDERTGSETRYVQLEVTNQAPIMEYSAAKNYAKQGFWRNLKSGKVWAVDRKTVTNRKTGDVRDMMVLRSASYGENRIEPKEFTEDKWERILGGKERQSWQAEVDEAPTTITRQEHLVTGALLPVWDRLIGHPRIMRVQTSEGERMIGRLIDAKSLDQTLKNLGAEGHGIKIEPADVFSKVLDQGFSVDFANKWEIKRKRVSGEYRIELTGPDYRDFNNLERHGVFSERINYQTRYFIPVTKSEGIGAIEAIVKNAPVVGANAPF
ncbi:MAG: bifunctional class I SAM-dependent methyltransferase/DEAD/DEAH box helicase, partial [bacterium]